jgi:ribose transport system substrate-binding protein
MHDRNLTRRQALALGATAVATAMAGSTLKAFADVVAQAKIAASEEIAKGTRKEGKLRIGFSNGFSGNSWRTECLASLKKEAANHTDLIEDLIIVDGQGDITKQVNDIEDLIVQNVDAIMCIPNSGSAVAPVLRKATRAGITTVPFNLPVEGGNYTAYVGVDPVTKGHQISAFFNETLGGKGKIVVLGGLPGNSYTAAIWEATQKDLSKDIEVLAFKDTNWEEDRAKIIMADLIAAHPQIDGVWCDGGQVATGAMKALLAAKRPLVPVTGDDYNGILKLYDAEKANHPNFKICMVSEPTWQSVVTLRATLDLLAGKDVPKYQLIGARRIDGSNYQEFIKPDLPDGVCVDTDLSDAELKAIFS